MIYVSSPAPSFAELGSPAAVGGMLTYLAPLGAPSGAVPLKTAVYGTAGAGGRPLELWVHRRADRTERKPGVLFVHGGGWSAGTAAFHLRHAFQLAARGFVTATATYRLSGEAPWPACIEDVKAAVRWMRASAPTLGLDPDRIAISGGSAGGHLAAMAAVSQSGCFEGTGGNHHVSSRVQAAVLWYPVVDLAVALDVENGNAMIDPLLPGHSEADVAAASPVNHVSDEAPPILTFVGDDDAMAPIPVLKAFHDDLSGRGVANELVVYENRVHGFDFHPLDWEDCFTRMQVFLAQHLGD